MKGKIGSIFLAGLLGGIGIGVTVWQAMQTYLTEGDKQDPIKELEGEAQAATPADIDLPETEEAPVDTEAPAETDAPEAEE